MYYCSTSCSTRAGPVPCSVLHPALLLDLRPSMGAPRWLAITHGALSRSSRKRNKTRPYCKRASWAGSTGAVVLAGLYHVMRLVKGFDVIEYVNTVHNIRVKGLEMRARRGRTGPEHFDHTTPSV
jgi:hypothetical protein